MSNSFLLKIKQPNNLLLICLLSVAAILRFWNFNELPLMHDELSALSRIEYDSFDDFMHYGIKLDGHPAGVQMFLYFFTAIFGYSTTLLKLPFILAGLAGLYLVYLIGKKWFSATAGLIACAFLVGIQYTILYSVIIRPYGPGLLFTLLLVNLWTDIFILRKKNWTSFICYGITLSLCAYTHYFALLFGAIVSLTGLFFIRKEIIVKYLVAGALSFLLFVPHLDIFFYQLGVGGIGASTGGWLKPPTIEFIPEYISYLFNYNEVGIGIAALILILSFRRIRSNVPKRLVLIFWFATPVVIGYWYSIEVNPVLQYSVLLFSTPYIFLFIASFSREEKFLFNVSSCLLILFISSVSLTKNRHHFTEFYKQPVSSYYNLIKKHYTDSTLLIGSHENVFIQHYDNLNNQTHPYFTTDEDCTTVAQYQKLFQDPKYNQIIVGTVSPREFGLAHSYFPELIHFEEGVTLENAVFQKNNKITAPQIYYTHVAFGSEKWPNKNNKIELKDSSFIMKNQWGISKVFFLDSLDANSEDIMELYGDFECLSPSQPNIVLVLEFKIGDKKVKWTGSSSTDLTFPSDRSFKSVNSQVLHFEDTLQPTSVVATVWNKSKSLLKINKLGIRLRKGNPNKFALYDRFKD